MALQRFISPTQQLAESSGGGSSALFAPPSCRAGVFLLFLKALAASFFVACGFFLRSLPASPTARQLVLGASSSLLLFL